MENNSARPIQIISPVNHQFQLQPENFRHVFEADDIKDRNVVIISIAGAFRKGKSFLLNFFLKYLYAQYKNHNVTDWIGESSNTSKIDGFTFRGGRMPETTGIWMWSEVFTHDFANGEKVAIILLDTQGIFDNQSSTKDCTATFAISMMMASLQCYNVMQNIQEDDIQNLELFTEYGRLATQQSSTKSFQHLMFIIRDWQYEFETPYGNAPSIVNDLLNENDSQTIEMQQLRKRIKSSFERIGAYLMPHPGFAVAQARQFTGGLQQINPKFINSLKDLMPLLLAPENLIVKKINGQKVRARDLLTYLQTYVNIFNGGTLPEPQSILMATAATTNLILYTECLNHFMQTMRKRFDEKALSENEPYLNPSDLQSTYENTRRESMSLFQKTPKLGGDEMIKEAESKLEGDIETKYVIFRNQNDAKKRDFEAKVKTDIDALNINCLESYVDSMQKSMSDVETFLSETEFQRIHNTAKDQSVSMFETHRKIGGVDLIEASRKRLNDSIGTKYMYLKNENDKKRQFAEDMRIKAEEAAARARADAEAKAREEAAQRAAAIARANVDNNMLYNQWLNEYKISMQRSIDENQRYYDYQRLQDIHNAAKANSLKMFAERRNQTGTDLTLESRLSSDINTNYIVFKNQNYQKQRWIQEAERQEELRRANEWLHEEVRRANERANWERQHQSRRCTIF